MNAFSTFWAILLSFAVGGFTILGLVIIIRGYGELKEIFRTLGRREREKKG